MSTALDAPPERTRSAVGEMRHAAFAFEIDTRSTSLAEGRFGGYASVFNTLIPSYNEMVDPGAFTETLANRGDRVRVLWQHDASDPIGVPTSMSEDAIGLKVEAQLADTPKIRGEYLPLMMPDTNGRAVVDRMSIGFRIMDDYQDPQTGVFHLRAVDLYEFSPVTFPANESAIISDVRSAHRVLGQAKRMMGMTDERPMSAEDAQYAMAILMGARGAGSFSDLPMEERRGLYSRLANEYERHGLTPPAWSDRPPVYSEIKFNAQEQSTYAARSLRKGLSNVTSTAQHAARLGVPIDSQLVAEAEAALDAIQALGLGGVQGRMDRLAEAARLTKRLGITIS